MEICGEMIGVLRFAGLCVSLLLDGLEFSNVFGFIGDEDVAFVSTYLYSPFLPPNSLCMITTVCAVSEI